MTFSSYDQRPCKSEVYRFVLWWHGAASKLVGLLKGMSCFPDWHQLILPQEILHILIRIWSGYLDGTQGCSHSGFALRGHHSLSSALIRRNVTQALSVGHVCNPSTWSGILRQEDCPPDWTTWKNNNKTKPTSSHITILPQNCSRVHVLKHEATVNIRGGGAAKFTLNILLPQLPQVCTTFILEKQNTKTKTPWGNPSAYEAKWDYGKCSIHYNIWNLTQNLLAYLKGQGQCLFDDSYQYKAATGDDS